jgi:hypothetical protein
MQSVSWLQNHACQCCVVAGHWYMLDTDAPNTVDVFRGLMCFASADGFQGTGEFCCWWLRPDVARSVVRYGCTQDVSGAPVNTLNEEKIVVVCVQLLLPLLTDCCLGMCCAFSQFGRLPSLWRHRDFKNCALHRTVRSCFILLVFIALCVRSRCGVYAVCWAIRGWVPGNGKRSRPALRPTQPRIRWVTGALSPGIKWPGREAERSNSSNVGVKNEWSKSQENKDGLNFETKYL